MSALPCRCLTEFLPPPFLPRYLPPSYHFPAPAFRFKGGSISLSLAAGVVQQGARQSGLKCSYPRCRKCRRLRRLRCRFWRRRSRGGLPRVSNCDYLWESEGLERRSRRREGARVGWSRRGGKRVSAFGPWERKGPEEGHIKGDGDG